MPYIGNNHIAGDHTNNFKVLDDISSYTATFDGSATSVVDTTNNTIRVVEHRFIQGQRVLYHHGGGGSNIGGLGNNTPYFVIFDSASTIKLATSASNAASSTAINLSAVGSGSSHTLNAAFDGVNTKFKLTHGSGTGARLNNATQINVAINNVVQRPNLDPNNFTDGFALEDNHKIVFQTAPTSEDIFWGSIIANTLTTFDISDHKIDTFTGDGSTTEFTLSHTPANNESLMVTINGVLQHPSNASTARAYTLIASIIQFTAAPGVGDEIQVRHLGFAGATTADVSGFYGRTGNVVLTDQDDIIVNKISVGTGATIESNGQATFVGVVTFGSSSTTIEGDNNLIKVGTALTLGHTQGLQFHTQNLHSDGFEINNINASGIITASSFVGNIGGNPTFSGDTTFNGSVSIGGTLTYEDVTNIDSVGLVTAREGVIVPDDKKLYLGNDQDLELFYQTSGVPGAYINSGNASGNFTIRNQDAGQYVYIHGDNVHLRSFTNNEAFLQAQRNGAVSLYYDSSTYGTPKLQTTATGVTINGTVVATGADINGDLDVDGHTNLDNVSIAGVTTFASTIVGANATFSGNINNSPVGNGSISGFGAITIQAPTPALNFTETDANPDYRIIVLGGQFRIQDVTNSNANRFIIDTDGTTSIEKNLNCLSDLDVDGHTNLDNVSIAGVVTATQFHSVNGSNSGFFKDNQVSFSPTGDAYIDHRTNNKDIIFRLSRSSALDTNMMQFDSDGEIIKFHKIISVGLQGGNDTATLGGGSGVGAQLTLKYADGTYNTHLLGNGNSYLNAVTGNLGIGTATVRNNRAMQLSGASNSIFLITGNGPGLCLNRDPDDSSDSDRTYLGVANVNNGYANGSQDGDTILRCRTGGKLLFATGTSIRARLTEDGCFISSNIGIGVDDRWKIRPNSSNTELAFEYSTSATLADSNIKAIINSSGYFGIGETSPQRYLHVTGNASYGAAHFGVFGTNAGNAYIGNTPVVTISTDGSATAGTNDEKAIFQVGRGGGGAGAAAVTTEHFRVNLGGGVQIGGAVGNNADIDIQNTKLTIKQSANNREDGIYIERTGERRGWLMFVGGSGNYNDAFCLSTNQIGTKTDVLAIDRGNRLAKLGGDVVIDSTNNGYGGLRIYDDTSGGYNVNYVGGRNDGNFCHKFFGGGRSQNQTPWTDASGFEIMRISLSNGLQLSGDTDSALQFHTGDHYKFKTKGRERVHLDNRGVLTAPKLSTKALIFSSCTNKWASSRTVTNFVMQFYTGASSATYHFMRMISQPDWAYDDVQITQYRYQYNPSGSDHTVRRYYTYYGSHSEQIVRFNQNGGGSGTGNDNYITKRTDFGPGGAFKIHEAANGGYYRDLWGSDYAISLGAYYGVVLEIKITASVGVYDTGDYATASDFYPAAYGGQASQSDANNHNGPRGVWFNTQANGTGSGTAPVISSKNSDRGWFTGANFLDTSA